MKNWRFSTNISFYFANDTRYGHSHNGRPIVSHTWWWSVYRHRFQWLWTTSNPDARSREYSTL